MFAAWKRVLALASALGLSSMGCLEDNPCSPGEKYETKVCLPDTPAESDGGATPADSGGDCRPPATLLGAECTGDDSCSEDAPYCAKQPGQDVGYCTRTECLDDPCVCPQGWDCFDLSVFQEGLPAICSMP